MRNTPSGVPLYSTATPSAPMSSTMIGITGSNQPHENMMPFQVVGFIIALFGIYPSRS